VTSGAKALVNAVDTFINSRRFALAAEAVKHKLPAVYSDVEYVLAGGLMALGPGHYEGYYNAAGYADKVLRGANPADLPIAGPTQFTLSVSHAALAGLGLSLPPDLSRRASMNGSIECASLATGALRLPTRCAGFLPKSPHLCAVNHI
jgi:putative tryptophan/tyrosine transport system substrate-binding protein